MAARVKRINKWIPLIWDIDEAGSSVSKIAGFEYQVHRCRCGSPMCHFHAALRDQLCIESKEFWSLEKAKQACQKDWNKEYRKWLDKYGDES